MPISVNASLRRIGSLGVLGTMLLPAACTSQDPVGMRLTVERGNHGTLAVSALSIPKIVEIEATDTAGVEWKHAARLELTSGTFTDLGELRFVDVEFDAAELNPDAGTLRVTLPRGDGAGWYRALHVGAGDRSELKRTLGGAVSEIDLHENITISVRIPDARVAAGLVTPVPRVGVSAKDDLATVIMPLAVLEADASPLILVVNWERPRPAAGD